MGTKLALTLDAVSLDQLCTVSQHVWWNLLNRHTLREGEEVTSQAVNTKQHNNYISSPIPNSLVVSHHCVLHV